METTPTFDFGGYATKVGLKCADGRTILKDAFKHNDGQKVPLVWQHLHNDPDNILGHAVLENREDGVYAYGKFNDTPKGQNARELVKHGDITDMSIYANNLKENGKNVVHGVIREVSLVLSGANPGAFIDNLAFAHGDGLAPVPDETEAVIYTGEPIQHMDSAEGERLLANELSSLGDSQKNRLRENMTYRVDDHQLEVIHNIINAMTASQRLAIYRSVADSVAKHGEADEGDALSHAKYPDDATVKDIFDTLDETQKTVVYAMVAQAVADNGEVEHSENEGETVMKVNVFDKSTDKGEETELKHAINFAEIVADAKRNGGSLRDAFFAHIEANGGASLNHAGTYGIDDIGELFPDARAMGTTPDMIQRDTGWVAEFLNATYKTPFSRIKSMAADVTADEARAKGYITGNKKKDEVFPVLKRITTPTTIYKKQKLDRDDIVDITDFDVVVWIRGEMRMMLDEELARAALIGDGRPAESEDKINPLNIRPIWTDDEIYAPKVLVDAGIDTSDLIDEFVKLRSMYKGSGNPNLYTSEAIVTDMLLVRDLNQRRIYPTMAELASALRVNKIIPVAVMEGQSRTHPTESIPVNLIGIVVNPRDYTFGADRGGQVSMFDDFDIDYNQYKYLIETRVSGTLVRPKSAVVIEQKQANG